MFNFLEIILKTWLFSIVLYGFRAVPFKSVVGGRNGR